MGEQVFPVRFVIKPRRYSLSTNVSFWLGGCGGHRIGHMNISSLDSSLHHIDYTLYSVQQSLEELGYKFPEGYEKLAEVKASRP